jgi:hypothetical protein
VRKNLDYQQGVFANKTNHDHRRVPRIHAQRSAQQEIGAVAGWHLEKHLIDHSQIAKGVGAVTPLVWHSAPKC